MADESLAEESPIEESPTEEGMIEEAMTDQGPADEGAGDEGAGEALSAEAPAAEMDDDSENLFAAMAELNASDEAWATAQGPVPAEAEVGAADVSPTKGEADAGEHGEAMTDVAALDWPEGPSLAAAAERIAEVTEEADDGAAPTVKEIIRRVGDLARELERAEAVRRAARGGGETDNDSPEAEAAFPPLHQAASG